jgi:hypothetical protein
MSLEAQGRSAVADAFTRVMYWMLVPGLFALIASGIAITVLAMRNPDSYGVYMGPVLAAPVILLVMFFSMLLRIGMLLTNETIESARRLPADIAITQLLIYLVFLAWPLGLALGVNAWNSLLYGVVLAVLACIEQGLIVLDARSS